MARPYNAPAWFVEMIEESQQVLRNAKEKGGSEERFKMLPSDTRRVIILQIKYGEALARLAWARFAHETGKDENLYYQESTKTIRKDNAGARLKKVLGDILGGSQ